MSEPTPSHSDSEVDPGSTLVPLSPEPPVDTAATTEVFHRETAAAIPEVLDGIEELTRVEINALKSLGNIEDAATIDDLLVPGMTERLHSHLFDLMARSLLQKKGFRPVSRPGSDPIIVQRGSFTIEVRPTMTPRSQMGRLYSLSVYIPGQSPEETEVLYRGTRGEVEVFIGDQDSRAKKVIDDVQAIVKIFSWKQ